LPTDAALDRATHFLARAQSLAPDSENVLAVQAAVLDFEGGPDYRRALSEQRAVAQRLVGLYPNNTVGYFRLGVTDKLAGKYDDAARNLAKAISLNPLNPYIKNFYWNMAYCMIFAGHDRDGLVWADRALAAQGDLASFKYRALLTARAVAHYRTGDLAAAKRLVAELNERYPFDTWRGHSPADPDSKTDREQTQSVRDALKAAGSRDHLDPGADFGASPQDVLYQSGEGKTPTAAPGVTTVNTDALAAMLEQDKPLIVDTMDSSWYRSVPGAVGLDFGGNAHGTFGDEIEKRLARKLHDLTGGEMARPIVAMAFNVARFDGYDLALRMRHAGYTNVYWYRGGREAWEVAGKPEDVVRPADW